MKGYGVIAAVALVTTLLMTPIVRLLAIRFGAVVQPSSDARHVHTKATPTLGGAAMFVGFLAAMAVASHMAQFRDMFADNSEPVGLLLGAGVMFVTGALDDLIEVSPPAKLAGQVLAASLLWLFGVSMFYFRTPFNLFHTGVVVLSPDLQPLITALWVVLMTNAVNLIDGLDGLAAGIVAIAGGALFLFADRLFKAGYLDGDNIAPLVAIIAVGVCIGFLPYNWHPSKIIMGDAGALFLGILLAVPTITIGGRTDFAFSGNTYFFFAPLAIPVIILGVPILDVDVLVRAPALAKTALAPGRRGPPPSPAHEPRARSAPHGRDAVGVDRAAVGRRARAHLHAGGQRGGAVRRGRASRCCSTPCSTPGCGAPASRPNGRRTPPAQATSDAVVDLDQRRRQRA